MFKDTEAFSSFAAPDTGEAKRFYGETLGIEVRDSVEEGLIELHFANRSPVLVYPKPDHQPATFTVLNLQVDDVEATAAELRERGIELEHVEGMTDDDGIFRGEGPVIAWFRDPAGNILSILQTG